MTLSALRLFAERWQPNDPPGWRFAVLLVLLATAAFWHVPELPRQIDDLPALRDAEKMRTDPWIFYSGVDHRTGRPAGHLARHVIYLLCGTSQRGFHLFSIALHIAIAFLVARLAFRWDTAAPRLAGTLFLLNVAHFKAVHHIAALEYLLAAGFSLGTCLLLWSKEELLTRPSLIALFCLCVIGAIASHVASWGMWPIFAWVMWQRGYRWQTALQLALPMFLINAAFSAHVLAQVRTDDYTTTSRALEFLASGEVWSLAVLRMFAWFVAYLFLFAHAAPWPMWEAPLWQIGIGTTLIVVALWQVCTGRSGPIRDCALWITCTLVPFALQSEETIRYVPGPSRYFYLSTVASSILIAEAVALARHLRGAGIWWGIAVCLCLGSSMFYLHKVEALSWYTGSIIARSEGNFSRANEAMRKAIEQGFAVIPQEEAYMRLLLVAAENNPRRAQADSRRAVERLPASQSLLAIDMALRAHRDSTALIRLLTHERRPLAAGILYSLSRGYFSHGDPVLARQAAAASLVLDPDKTNSLDLLGSLLVGFGEMDRGLSYLQKAAAIKGDSTVYHTVLQALGRRATQ